MNFVYVATPYSHPDPAVRQDRYALALHVLETLAKYNIACYSPIAHWHNVALAGGLPTDAAFWWNQNNAIMEAAFMGLFILSEGHDTSVGMDLECRYFFANKKIITHTRPEHLDTWCKQYPTWGYPK